MQASHRSKCLTSLLQCPTSNLDKLVQWKISRAPEGGETKNNSRLTETPPTPPIPRRVLSARTACLKFLRRPDDMARYEFVSTGTHGLTECRTDQQSSQPALPPPAAVWHSANYPSAFAVALSHSNTQQTYLWGLSPISKIEQLVIKVKVKVTLLSPRGKLFHSMQCNSRNKTFSNS